jgi:anti-sigma regulatory factor (Ser/Thr protein kinase)
MTRATLSRTLTIANETSQLQAVRAFVADAVTHSAIPRAYLNGIILAVDEAVTNIITHAYAEGRHDTIEISLLVEPARFEVVIRDSGITFDPKTIAEPDLHTQITQARRHGLGIFLMRRVMDEVEYLFKEGVRNELRMVKYLNGQPPRTEKRMERT